MSTKQTTSSGIGVGMILFLIFLVLKLTGHIDWSWWWVFCPLWAPLVIFIGFLAIVGLLALIAAVIEKL